MFDKSLKPGDWYEDCNIAGFVRNDGSINVVIEKNLSDQDTGAFFDRVLDGDGYYDTNGKFHSYPYNPER